MTILVHPTAAHLTTTPVINAELLFRHPRRRLELEERASRGSRDTRVELHPITVAGVECLTDGDMLVRTDRLVGVDDSWARIGNRVDGPPPGLSRAFRARPSNRRVRHRFDPSIVCGFYLVGAGIVPLAGEHDHDMHGVVLAGELVGLVGPLRPIDAESVLGVIPGRPHWPATSVDTAATGTEGQS